MDRFEGFWDVMCEFRYFLRLGFMLVVFLFVLSVIALLLADRGTDAYAISLVNFSLVAVLGVVVGWMARVCSRRERKYY